MNLLRLIRPLWLREKLFFHIISKIVAWPATAQHGIRLEFAPARIFHLLPTDYAHRQIAWMGFYERGLSKRLSGVARRGGVLVDVGANTGYFSILWAALNPGNLVYAFEPSPCNLKMLEKNVAAQGKPERIQIFGYGLSKESGQFEFDLGPEDQSGWGSLTRSKSSRSIAICVRRLDEILPPDLVVDFLKIDTEGADAWVLYGAEELLRKKRIRAGIYEENLSRMRALGIEPVEPRAFLYRMGYVVRSQDNGGMVEFYAPRDQPVL